MSNHSVRGKWRLSVVAAAVAAVALAAAPGTPVAAEPTVATANGKITVLAAASLTEVFKDLGARFEAKNPGSKVTFSFGASPTLAQQIVAKAPADVFAAASPATMKTVTDAGEAATAPVLFVRNRLLIATPARQVPAKVDDLKDFERASLNIVVCAVAVPCGAAAQKVFDLAGVNPSIDSYEQDVKAVLTKVALGEADAGLVYKTDVQSAGGTRIRGFDFPESSKAINDYPVAVLKESKNRDTAQAWIDYLRSDEARKIFEAAGFMLP